MCVVRMRMGPSVYVLMTCWDFCRRQTFRVNQQSQNDDNNFAVTSSCANFAGSKLRSGAYKIFRWQTTILNLWTNSHSVPIRNICADASSTPLAVRELAWLPIVTCHLPHTHACNFPTREFSVNGLSSRAARFVWIMRLNILLNFMFVARADSIRWQHIYIIYDMCWRRRRRRMRYSTLIWNEKKWNIIDSWNYLFLAFTQSPAQTHARGAAAFVWRKICCVRAIVCFIYLFPSKTIIHLHWPRIAFVP